MPKASFQVILIPAALNNLRMILEDPASSNTNTWEWASTWLFDDNKKDTGRALEAGYSVDGGAANLNGALRLSRYARLGARLAVVFK